jgi:hypothetical protein
LPLPLPLARLAAVELGAELVAAALPAFGHLLDRVADGLEAVQLPRPCAVGRRGPGRRTCRGPAGTGRGRLPGPEGLDPLVEVAGEAPQLEQGLREHALGRGQLARSRRPLGGQRLDQRPAGGQLLAPQCLLVVPRTPLSLWRHRSLLPWTNALDRVASGRRFEYPDS